MESWLTTSVKVSESALTLGRYGVHGAFLDLLHCNLYSYRLETGVSGNLCSFLQEVKPLVLYHVEHVIPMEPMKGKWASSGVDVGYTKLFCMAEVTSVFFSSCASVPGVSLVFHQENRGSLHV